MDNIVKQKDTEINKLNEIILKNKQNLKLNNN